MAFLPIGRALFGDLIGLKRAKKKSGPTIPCLCKKKPTIQQGGGDLFYNLSAASLLFVDVFFLSLLQSFTLGGKGLMLRAVTLAAELKKTTSSPSSSSSSSVAVAVSASVGIWALNLWERERRRAKAGRMTGGGRTFAKSAESRAEIL